MHIRGPLPNGTKYLPRLSPYLVFGFSSHLSGTKDVESGYICSSRSTSRVVIETGVPGGMVYSLYLMGLLGETRGSRTDTPMDSRTPSLTQAARYGSFSSATESGILAGSGMAFSSSACSFRNSSGLSSRWKTVVVSAHATVSTPAPIICCASEPSRRTVFSGGGRLLFSSSSKMVGCSDFTSLFSLCLIILEILPRRSWNSTLTWQRRADSSLN